MADELAQFKLVGKPDWDKIAEVVKEDLAELKKRKTPQWESFFQDTDEPVGFRTCEFDNF